MANSHPHLVLCTEASGSRLQALHRARNLWAEPTDPVSRLHRRLGTTLELEKLLAIFAEELQQTVPYGQLTYRHRIGEEHHVYSTGMGGAHRCDYQLNLENSHYGNLSLTRRHRFTEAELEAIEYLLGILILPLRNACQHAEVRQAALTDALTGIPNKRALDLALSRDCGLGDRHGDVCTLILCDLDHFKAVNDTWGHVIGDHLLKASAMAIRSAVRETDSIFRFGGEEFAILLPHTDSLAAKEVAERIQQAIAALTVTCGKDKVSVTASAGLATRRAGEKPREWLIRADEALYRAKAAGRNCVRLAHSL